MYLGTGIGAHMLSRINKTNIPGPKAVILESPFNNIRDEVTAHPFAKVRQFKDLFCLLILTFYIDLSTYAMVQLFHSETNL